MNVSNLSEFALKSRSNCSFSCTLLLSSWSSCNQAWWSTFGHVAHSNDLGALRSSLGCKALRLAIGLGMPKEQRHHLQHSSGSPPPPESEKRFSLAVFAIARALGNKYGCRSGEAHTFIKDTRTQTPASSRARTSHRLQKLAPQTAWRQWQLPSATPTATAPATATPTASATATATANGQLQRQRVPHVSSFTQ